MSDTFITNWGDMESPASSAYFSALDKVWSQNQANADVWAEKALESDKALREQQQKNLEEWQKQQENWRDAWIVAQAAYAAAQTLLANNALEAAKDAAEKQYEIADRQQQIAEREYERYSAHFAACEDATIDAECARPEYLEPIEQEANRAIVDIRRQFGIARAQAQRRRNRYCIGSVIAIDRQLSIDEARAGGEAKERVRRFLEERQESRRDKFFNRKIQLFNIGRNIQASSVTEMNAAAQGFQRGTDIELAARNQFYGAILSSLGGLMGAGLSMVGAPTGFGSAQGGRTSSSIGGSSSFSSAVGFGGAGLMGPGGLGYGFGASNSGTLWDANTLGPSSTFA
ncbi:hypothetical protein OKW41_006017 [Paraburkholderia sp. UCT70]|uniref:hypothetical protein n=1 Tax=Paraburkholderia sp. UCT70 TaxID=2991068 RepID=UPI003D1E0646